MNKVAATCIAIVSIAILASTPSYAVESAGIGLLPGAPRSSVPRSSSIIIHKVAPGQHITDKVKVANNSSTVKTLTIYATDSQMSSDGAFACAQLAEAPQKVGKWVSLAKSSVTLQPQTSELIDITIIMPQHIQSGEYNGCIAVQESNPQSSDPHNGITLQFRSAIRVALTVPGDLDANIIIDNIDREPLRGVTRLRTTVRNNGSVSVDSGFNVQFSTLFGGIVPDVGLGTYTVFPQVSSVFNFEVKNPFWGGWYKMYVQTVYHEPLDSGEPSSEKTIKTSEPMTVFIMPAPLALLIEGLAFLALLFGTAFLVRLLRERSLDRKHSSLYTVRPGETIQSIANRHDVSWRRIASYNHLKAPYILRTSQKLKLPYSPSVHHKKIPKKN